MVIIWPLWGAVLVAAFVIKAFFSVVMAEDWKMLYFKEQNPLSVCMPEGMTCCCSYLFSCQTLCLRQNLVKRIENLEQLQTLRELDLYDNQIRKIENLEALVDLEWVMGNHQVWDVGGLSLAVLPCCNYSSLYHWELSHDSLVCEGQYLVSIDI